MLSFNSYLLEFMFLKTRVSFYRGGWPWTGGNLPVSIFQVLGHEDSSDCLFVPGPDPGWCTAFSGLSSLWEMGKGMGGALAPLGVSGREWMGTSMFPLVQRLQSYRLLAPVLFYEGKGHMLMKSSQVLIMRNTLWAGERLSQKEGDIWKDLTHGLRC